MDKQPIEVGLGELSRAVKEIGLSIAHEGNKAEDLKLLSERLEKAQKALDVYVETMTIIESRK